jgi:hypothetical protein
MIFEMEGLCEASANDDRDTSDDEHDSESDDRESVPMGTVLQPFRGFDGGLPEREALGSGCGQIFLGLIRVHCFE